MKKVLKGLAAFSFVLSVALIPAATFACTDSCAASAPCAVAAPCPAADPCNTAPAAKCPESVVFVNDSGCDKHITISYRTKGIFGLLFHKNLNLTLASGEIYTFNYDKATTWSKSVLLKGVHSDSTKKIQSQQVWFLSEVEKTHGMPFGAAPHPRVSVL